MTKKEKALRSEIKQLKRENKSLQNKLAETVPVMEQLSAREGTAKRVLAMAQYLLRVADQFDTEAKRLLGIKDGGGRGP